MVRLAADPSIRRPATASSIALAALSLAMWGCSAIGSSERTDASIPEADVLSGTCYIGDAGYPTGERYFDGCRFCVCGPAGSQPVCWTRVCGTDSGLVETPFRPVGSGMCDAQVRTLHQPNEAEVRYPCGIPGGTPRENDPRCASLCAPGLSRTYDRMWCNRAAEPNTVVCWGL
ncbi:MAG: hypothetical protein JNK05_30145 [Myxococcales bacterium]|nr:hypothetical protein [Myxococcales bacterium]